VDEAAVMADDDVLGRMLDSFVTAQIRAELDHLDFRARLHHLRQSDGRREIDLVVELAGNRVIAIEVKATAAPTMKDARHLVWLRDEIGDRFVRGVVFHTGPAPFELSDRVLALPISSLWI
jgi:uncharacterized protein